MPKTDSVTTNREAAYGKSSQEEVGSNPALPANSETTWHPIETAPQGHKAVWVANTDGMEPCHYRFGKWVNCYTGTKIDFVPEAWHEIPEYPNGRI